MSYQIQAAVWFAHGQESGPWGSKITHLAGIARGRGCTVESPDYGRDNDAERRVGLLLKLCSSGSGRVILVGSSMGAYVSAVASATIQPRGLFLLAPAFYIAGYAQQSPVPHAAITALVHGWQDMLIPAASSIRYAECYQTELHLCAGDHRLNDQLPFIGPIFAAFLDRCLAD